MLDVLRHLKQEPKHFHSADHVPAKDRARMFGLNTIDNNSWLIGDRAVLTRRHGASWPADTPGLISTWTATDDGACYAISNAPVPPPPSRPWRPEEDPPKLVHLAAGGPPVSGLPDAHVADVMAKCVYYVGGVFIKMHHALHCDSTDEHITINTLRKQLPDRTFELPNVLYHAKYDNRYFLVTSGVAGQPAESIWWELDDSTKDYYAELVAQSCCEIATLTSSELATGVDGSMVEERDSRLRQGLTRKDQPDMMANCRALGLDVEPPFFCLYHGDQGPTNVLIDREKRKIGVVDWQAAEFVPRDWIGINFARAMAMLHNPPLPEGYSANDYANRVWIALQRRGFRNDGEAWRVWKEVDCE